MQRSKMYVDIWLMIIMLGLVEAFIVQTDKGPVKGNIYYAGQHEVYSFKNIPFAKSPVGKLRFKIPMEHDEWYSVDDRIKDLVISCPQSSFVEGNAFPNGFRGVEDCLYLDVYVRKEHQLENASIPVLVYFHAGGFARGSKEEYGPDFLLRYNDIILVIPNYRLGILGFLSFKNSTLPGNLGLWDQWAALKWVSKNIGNFGGDPQRVTIAGHEAGGVSVGLHILAQYSHDFFQSALSVSGTALSPFSLDQTVASTAEIKVIKALGCATALGSETLACLNEVPLQKIMEIQYRMRNFQFLPTVDAASENPFIPSHPRSLYQRGFQKSVRYLVGYAEDEASYEVSKEFRKVLKFQNLDKIMHHFMRPYFQDVPNFEMIMTAAKYHYLRGVFIPSFESIEPKITTMLTDFLYKSPLEEVIKLHGQKTENIFMYVFQHENKNSCGADSRRCFGDERYVFNSSYGEKTLEREKISEIIAKVWGNFIKYGHPDGEGKWLPFGNYNHLNYAEIVDRIQPKKSENREDTEFWTGLVSDLRTAQNTSDKPSNIEPSSEYSGVGTWGAAGLAILFSVLCVALIGLVVITKRRSLTVSILPVSSPKDKFRGG